MDLHKYSIIYDVLCAIDDPEFRSFVNMIIVGVTHPVLFDYFSRTDQNKFRSLNYNHLHSAVHSELKLRCIKTLESMTGRLVAKDDSCMLFLSELMRQFKIGIKKTSLLAVEVFAIKNLLEGNRLKLNRQLTQRQQLVDKYCHLQLTFKLPLDTLSNNYLCFQSKDIYQKHSLQNIIQVYNKCGTAESIQRLEEKKRLLKEDRVRLENQIKDIRGQLSKYEDINPRVLSEFKRLKQDMCEMKWAKDQLAGDLSDDDSF